MTYDDNTRRLHLAIMDNELPLVKKLIRNGAWVCATDRLGRSALHWAVVFGNRDTTHLILKVIGKGAGVNIADNNGCTALHYAAMEGRVDIAKMLLNRKAKINEQDKEQMTPLHYAAQSINPLMIHNLVRRKANKMVLDLRNRLPYHVAQQWGGSNDVLHRLQPDNYEAICAQIQEMGGSPLGGVDIKIKDTKAKTVEDMDGDLRLWVLSAKAYSSATALSIQRDRPIENVKREMIIEADASRRLLGMKARPGASRLREEGTQTAPPASSALNMEALQSLLSKFIQCFKSAGSSFREHTPSMSTAHHWVPSKNQLLRADLAEGGHRKPVHVLPVILNLPKKPVHHRPGGSPQRKPTPYPLKPAAVKSTGTCSSSPKARAASPKPKKKGPKKSSSSSSSSSGWSFKGLSF